MICRPTLALTLILLASSAVFAAGRPAPPGKTLAPESPTETEEMPAPLRLLRASYEIDVLGPLAAGELIRELVSDVDAELAANSFGPLAGLDVESLEVEVAGDTRDVSLQASAPRSGRGSASARAGSSRARPAERPQPSETIQVEAGQPVTVRATFRMALPLRDGRLLLRLPAVTGREEDAHASGEDLATPAAPVGAITISIHDDEPLLHLESATHDVLAAYEGDRTVVELAEGESESRDFELEFALGVEDDPRLAGQVSPAADGAHDVILVLTPPMEPGEGAVRPKQVFFVLDSSGSMAKGKLDQAREALAPCLENLRGDDLFNIVAFKNDFKMMVEEPVRGEGASLQRARGWLGALRPGGGTELLPALLAVFEQPEETGHHRMIVLLTDGAIRDRREVMEPLQQGLGEARLFVIGIGEDVTRETILRLAEYGRGTAVFADDPEGLDEIVTAMFASVSDPLAWDLALDWGGAEVESMEPSRLPDLYAGRPVTVRARIRGELPEQVTLEASTTGGLRQFATELAPAGEGRRSKLGHR
jgi:Ca-activated chloride channel family protein